MSLGTPSPPGASGRCCPRSSRPGAAATAWRARSRHPTLRPDPTANAGEAARRTGAAHRASEHLCQHSRLLGRARRHCGPGAAMDRRRGGSNRGGAGAAHRSRCSLWPSWPLTPRPQEKTSPLARPSSVWRQPHASIAISPPSRPPTRLGSGLSAVSPVPSCPNCARSRARVSAGAGGPHARGRLLSACCAAAAPGPD